MDFPLFFLSLSRIIINKNQKGSLMKKLFFLFILIPASYLISQNEITSHSFVGVQVCAPCHKTEKQGGQLDIWQKSEHSKAYETLKTEEANQIAKEKGFSTPAVETQEC